MSADIKIPRAERDEVAEISSGNFGFQEKTNKRFDKIDNLLFGIIAGVILSAVAVIIAVVGLFLDQLRFNNVAYAEYTAKIKFVDDMQKNNLILMQQNGSQQKHILELQGQVRDLLLRKK